MSLLSVVKQTYDSFPSFPATGCTLDGFGEDRDHCVPQIAKDYKLLVISNITLVIIIGGFGNLFNIVAICVARIRHRQKFEHLWNSITILMVNLSLCDLLYCFLGLPVFISIYYNGYLPQTDSFCWYSAMIRNWIAYTEFLTTASIAANRLVGFLLFSYNMKSAAKWIFNPIVTTCECVGIWIFTFIMISPLTFSLTIGPYEFGTFGYDARVGKCDEFLLPVPKWIGIVILSGFYISSLLIIISYIFIGINLELRRRRTEKILNNQSQVPYGQIQKTLLILSISHILFFLPLVVVDNPMIKVNRDLLFLCHAWNWWSFAFNFLLYIITLEDFRKLYRQLLCDINILKSVEDMDDGSRSNARSQISQL